MVSFTVRSVVVVVVFAFAVAESSNRNPPLEQEITNIWPTASPSVKLIKRVVADPVEVIL